MEANMISNPRSRRALSLAVMALGGVLLFLVPQDIWIGTFLLGLGIGLEVAGTRLHRRP
jgi:hypothetical protein